MPIIFFGLDLALVVKVDTSVPFSGYGQKRVMEPRGPVIEIYNAHVERDHPLDQCLAGFVLRRSRVADARRLPGWNAPVRKDLFGQKFLIKKSFASEVGMQEGNLGKKKGQLENLFFLQRLPSCGNDIQPQLKSASQPVPLIQATPTLPVPKVSLQWQVINSDDSRSNSGWGSNCFNEPQRPHLQENWQRGKISLQPETLPSVP
jgi:hypothetical protein